MGPACSEAEHVFLTEKRKQAHTHTLHNTSHTDQHKEQSVPFSAQPVLTQT